MLFVTGTPLFAEQRQSDEWCYRQSSFIQVSVDGPQRINHYFIPKIPKGNPQNFYCLIAYGLIYPMCLQIYLCK